MNAIKPAMATISDALLVIVSSPYARSGIVWDAFDQHYGVEGDSTHVWVAPSLAMNPSLDPAIPEQALLEDPARAAAEWNAVFRSDVEKFIALEIVMECVSVGVTERPPLPNVPTSHSVTRRAARMTALRSQSRIVNATNACVSTCCASAEVRSIRRKSARIRWTYARVSL